VLLNKQADRTVLHLTPGYLNNLNNAGKQWKLRAISVHILCFIISLG